jgi:FixJ family two-component response regulator
MPRTPDGAPTVLIIEDDQSLLNALTFALRADGFNVRPYPSAESLLAEADRVRADCLVIDLKLPSLDGLSLLTMLRDKAIGAPAILITSNPDSHALRRARAAGVPIIEKPLVNSALQAAVALAIAKPTDSPQATA